MKNMVELNNLNNKGSRKFNGWNLKITFEKGKNCFEPNSWRFWRPCETSGVAYWPYCFWRNKTLWTQYTPAKTNGKTTWKKNAQFGRETHRSKQSFWSNLVVSLEFFGGVLYLEMVENRTSNQSPSFKINPIDEIVPRNVAYNSPPRANSRRR